MFAQKRKTAFLSGRPIGWMALALLVIVSTSGMHCTHCDVEPDTGVCKDEEQEQGFEPVYMPYSVLRQAISVVDNVPLTDFGKIYVYQNYLFINSKNKGVHVFNNSNPEVPSYIGFIRVPGNLDMEYKNGYLFLDSYIDLVVVDVVDFSNIQEVNRVQDHFPYDVYQSVPDHIYFDQVDQSRGVVVGYREKN